MCVCYQVCINCKFTIYLSFFLSLFHSHSLWFRAEEHIKSTVPGATRMGRLILCGGQLFCESCARYTHTRIHTRLRMWYTTMWSCKLHTMVQIYTIDSHARKHAYTRTHAHTFVSSSSWSKCDGCGCRHLCYNCIEAFWTCEVCESKGTCMYIVCICVCEKVRLYEIDIHWISFGVYHKRGIYMRTCICAFISVSYAMSTHVAGVCVHVWMYAHPLLDMFVWVCMSVYKHIHIHMYICVRV